MKRDTRKRDYLVAEYYSFTNRIFLDNSNKRCFLVCKGCLWILFLTVISTAVHKNLQLDHYKYQMPWPNLLNV
jgi:hypothetical protein